MWEISNIKNIKIDKIDGYDRYSLSFECDYEDGFVGDKRTLLIEVPNAYLAFNQENKIKFDFCFQATLGLREHELETKCEPYCSRITVI
jgi:hypothetical protein